jgi:hypothetical protein
MSQSKRFPLKWIVLCGAAAVLTGCAVNHQSTGVRGVGLTYHSGVQTLPDGNFFAEVEAALGAGRQSGASKAVSEQATAFCAQRGQKMTEIKRELDTNIVIHGIARLTFQCK